MALGAILGGLGSIGSAIGGIIGSNQDAKASENANRRNRNMAMRQFRFNRRAIQKAVRWRVEDVMQASRKHAIHPLALLGIQPQTSTPISAGQVAYTGRSAAYSQAGQNLAHGLNQLGSTVRTGHEKAIAALSLERAKLENDLLKSRIASEIRTSNQAGSAPGVPGGDRIAPGSLKTDVPSIINV